MPKLVFELVTPRTPYSPSERLRPALAAGDLPCGPQIRAKESAAGAPAMHAVVAEQVVVPRVQPEGLLSGGGQAP